MSEFHVWAPKASQVSVQAGGEEHAMEKAAGGWWQIDLPAAGPGTDYAFRLDGGAPLPDPRSPWQPAGVNGPSRILDHTAFPWTDVDWRPPPLASAVIYELHVGTFSPAGTFAGVIERLDYLHDLGVTHLELLPVAQFDGPRGWGYDGVDLYAPHEAYGGPEGLKELVDACHSRGLAVLLDVVYNHLGPSGNYLAQFGPYFTERYKTPWGPAVNLDGPGSDEVRRFFIDNALMWLGEYHFDGLRLDAIHAILDTSAVHFLEELAGEVAALSHRLGKQLVLIGESDLNDPRVVRSPEAGGYGLDAQWSDDFHHALHTLLTGERGGYYADFDGLSDLAVSLQQSYVYAGRHSEFRGRKHGRPPQGVPAERFLAYLQNHDQIGNRAQGDRISTLVTTGQLKVAAALVLLSPFIPMLFQGEEWGASTPFQYFTSFADEALGEAVRKGRREEFVSFGWQPDQVPDPQARETFDRSRLDWAELEQSLHREVLDWHRRLIALRRSERDLAAGWGKRLRVDFDAASGWLVLERGNFTIACNLSPESQAVPLDEGRCNQLVLASEENVQEPSGGVWLPPHSVAVYRS